MEQLIDAQTKEQLTVGGSFLIPKLLLIRNETNFAGDG